MDGQKGSDCVGMGFMDVELVVGEGMWWLVSLAFVVSHPLCISLSRGVCMWRCYVSCGLETGV